MPQTKERNTPDEIRASWRVLQMLERRFRRLVLSRCEQLLPAKSGADDMVFLVDEIADHLHDHVELATRAGGDAGLAETDEVLSHCRRLLESINEIRRNVHFFGSGGDVLRQAFQWLVSFRRVAEIRQQLIRKSLGLC